MRIPDPIERGEQRMESWADGNMRSGEFKCSGCDKWTPIEDAQQISPDPYSAPGCSSCLEEHFGSLDEQSK